MVNPSAQDGRVFDHRSQVSLCVRSDAMTSGRVSYRAGPELILALKIPRRRLSEDATYIAHLRCIAAIEELTSRNESSQPIYPPKDVRRLRPLLSHPSAAIRSPAAYHLNQYLRVAPASSLVVRLTARLARKDLITSAAAAQALREVNTPILRKRLLKHLASKKSHTRKLAASLGSQITDKAFIADAFDKARWRERLVLADILLYGTEDKSRLTERFVGLLQSDRWQYRALALYALQAISQECPAVALQMNQIQLHENHPGVQAVQHMIAYPRTEHFPAIRLSDLKMQIRAFS